MLLARYLTEVGLSNGVFNVVTTQFRWWPVDHRAALAHRLRLVRGSCRASPPVS
jgi:hypothetical protein